MVEHYQSGSASREQARDLLADDRIAVADARRAGLTDEEIVDIITERDAAQQRREIRQRWLSFEGTPEQEAIAFVHAHELGDA